MIKEDVRLGSNVKIFNAELVNLYGCEIGDNTKIGSFVEVQKNARIGRNCKIQSHSFICEGVTIGDNCFISHGVVFINDNYPRATKLDGSLETEKDWINRFVKTNIGNNVSIGSNATILGGISVGDNSLIGAGAVVTKSIPPNTIFIGNPARELKKKQNILPNDKKVPFLDLKKQYLSIKQEIDDAIKKTIENTAFILGPGVEEFENNFANFCGVKYAVGVNSGTEALHLALLSLGIGSGDEVITVPNTFIATAEAISHTGAKPIFVDIDKENYNMNSDLIKEKITVNTKAIMPVHLFGNPCDMDKINEIAKKHNLFVIEDACQAHGAEYKGRRVGSLSDIAAFSFYPGKNLGAYGEGGIIVTNNEELANKCKLLRAHGEYPKNIHSLVGFNYRMHGLQGAILNVKLKYLDDWNEARRKKAELYNSLLNELGNITIPKINESNKHVFHLYVIRTEKRDELREFLKSKGIDTGIHYLFPIHLQEAYKHLNLKEGDYPIAEKYAKEILSLPIFPELTEEQIGYIADSIKEFYKKDKN